MTFEALAESVENPIDQKISQAKPLHAKIVFKTRIAKIS